MPCSSCACRDARRRPYAGPRDGRHGAPRSSGARTCKLHRRADTRGCYAVAKRRRALANRDCDRPGASQVHRGAEALYTGAGAGACRPSPCVLPRPFPFSAPAPSSLTLCRAAQDWLRRNRDASPDGRHGPTPRVASTEGAADLTSQRRAAPDERRSRELKNYLAMQNEIRHRPRRARRARPPGSAVLARRRSAAGPVPWFCSRSPFVSS